MPLDSIYKFKINKMASKYKMAYSEVLSVMPKDGIYKFKINMMAAYSEVLSVMSEDGIYKFKIKKMASKHKMAYSEVLGVMPEDSVGVHVLVDLPAGVLHTGGEGRGPACEHPYLASLRNGHNFIHNYGDTWPTQREILPPAFSIFIKSNS